MTLGKLLEDTTLYDTVAVYRDDAIEGMEEFCCDAEHLSDAAMPEWESDENLLECEVLSMFAKILDDGEVALCIGLDWEGGEWA